MSTHEPEKRNKSDEPALDKLSSLFTARANSVDSSARPGFKEALQMRLQGAREQHRMTKTSFSAFFATIPGRLAAAGTTALVVALVAVMIFQPFSGNVPTVYAQDNFTLTPELSDKAGIDANTSFLLESKEPISVGDIEPLLRASIDAEFALERVSETQARLRFEEPLPEGKVIQISLDASVQVSESEVKNRDYGWAFQVKDPFKIIAQIPAHETANVPVNTGIEFTFSNPEVSVEDFEAAFSISPEVEGRFQKERETLIFVPTATLEPETLYTVSLEGTLSPGGSEDVLGESVLVTFETAPLSPKPFYFSLWNDVNHLAPGETVEIPFSYRNDASAPDSYEATVYEFASGAEYAEAIARFHEVRWQRTLSRDRVLNGAEIVSEATMGLSVISKETGYPSEFLQLDGGLDQGLYAVLVTGGGVSRWTFVDVSNLVAYYVTAQNEQMLWVNSLETHGSVSGAKVTSYATSGTATTDARGIAMLPALTEYQSNDVVLIEYAGDQTVIQQQNQIYYHRASYGTSGYFMNSGDYWAYLYTDRTSYLPSDTIEVWGYLRDRDGTEDIDTVELVLNGRGYEYNRVKADVVDGFYRATIRTYQYQPGWYELSVTAGEQDFSYANITIVDYTKPAYDLDVKVSDEVIKNGDSISISMHGEFFDGTPVKGLGLNIGIGRSTDSDSVVLDGTGDAEWSETVSLPVNGALLAYQSYTVRPTQAEEGEIESRDSVAVLLTDVYAEAEATIKGAAGTVGFTTYQTDKESLLANLYDPSFARKANQVITGTVVERWSERIEDGTRYDSINKITVPQYRYVTHEDPVDSFTLTSDENGQASFEFAALRDDASYRVTYRVDDGKGAYYSSSAYAYRIAIPDDEEAFGPLWLTTPDVDRTNGVTLGEEVTAQVVRDSIAFSPAELGRFLYVESQRGIRKLTISSDPTYTFTFGEEHVPDIYLSGVYFNGYGYAEFGGGGFGAGSGHRVSLDHRERELTVDVTVPDALRPGEEAEISIKVTDSEGNPIKAQVNLSIVDEAYFALFPSYFDPLEVVYSPVLSGIYASNISRHIDEFTSGGAEGGGGGGDEGRSDFKDTAAFVVANTNSNGQADVSFTLPDNLTSWRISTSAISLGAPSDPLYVGMNVSNIAATLPYFVVPVMKDSYLDGDVPQIAVRSAGTTLELSDAVDYHLWFQEEDLPEQTKTATGGDTVLFELPDLPSGIYHVTIEGKANGYEDRVTREVAILPSRIQVPVIETHTLESGAQLTAPTESGMTFIQFMDGSRGKLYGSIAGASWSYGSRADQLLARNVATDLLNRYFAGDRTLENGSLADYQSDSGLIRLLPYASEEIELTAKSAFAGDSVFDTNGLRHGLMDAAADEDAPLTEEELAWVLAGRAALHDSVLIDIQDALEEVDAENLRVRLPLILGLYYIGATEEARVHYRELTDESVVKLGQRSLGLDDPDTNLELTALMGILSAGLNEPQVDEYWSFLEETYSKNTTVVLEKTLMLKEWVSQLPEAVPTVEYTLHGERVTQELKNGISDRLVLRPEEFATLNLITSGQVVAVTERFGGPEELEGEPSDLIGLTREYRVNGVPTNTFKEGDLVEVRISRSFQSGLPSASYELIDVLPSGLSIVSSPRGVSRYGGSGTYCVNYPRTAVDNRVTFYTWSTYSRKGCPENTTIYYARVVTPGTYEAEAAFLRSYEDPSTYTFSNASEVTITD